MSLASRYSIFLLLALSACAASHSPQPQAQADLATTHAQSAPEKLDALISATQRLREQYEAMGETLKWQEGEIAALRQNSSTPMPLTPQQPKAIKGAEHQAEKPPESHSEVGALTEQDLQPLPQQAAPSPTATTHHTGPTSYYVHIASFNNNDMASRGWKHLKSQYALLQKTDGAIVAFTDKKHKTWQRLLAGPFPTENEATSLCAALKKKKSWCEVLPLTEDLVTKLP